MKKCKVKGCSKIAALVLLLSSCITAPVKQVLDPNKIYKKDLILESTFRAGVGTVVLKDRNSYKITITSPYSMNILKITSCHRSLVIEDKKITKKAKTYFGKLFKIQDNKMLNSKTFYYTQVDGIEKTKYSSCPLEIESYSTEEGRYSTGFVAFENDNLTLPANIECGGIVASRNGTSVCQERKGLRQGISFNKPVDYEVTPSDCNKMRTKDNMNFYYRISPKRCSYTFLTYSGKDERHRLITIGFDERILK